jgi:hypothetical protein
MNTTKTMIPLALFFILIFKNLGFGMQPPQTNSLLISDNPEQVFFNESETYPILSTKNYQYELDQYISKQNIIIFKLDDETLIYLYIDDEGKYHPLTESQKTQTTSPDEASTSLIDQFRFESKSLIKFWGQQLIPDFLKNDGTSKIEKPKILDFNRTNYLNS